MHPLLRFLHLLVAWGLWWYFSAGLPFESIVAECALWYCLKCIHGLVAAAGNQAPPQLQ